MSTLELASNYYGTRAHWTDNLEPRGRGRDGRSGDALCTTEINPVDVYDQASVDADMPRNWRKRKVIVEMPMCKRCERIKAKREAGA